MSKKEQIEERIMSLIFLTGRNLRQEGNKGCLDVKDRLSMIQFAALKFIDEREKPLMRLVAEHLLITPPTLTQLIDEMEKKKLVERISSENDRRAILVVLTKRGKVVLEKNLKAKIKKLSLIFQKLSNDEQKILVRLMEKMASPVKKI